MSRVPRRVVLCVALAGVLAASLTLVFCLGRDGTPATTPVAAATVSPVFGVNMSLLDGGDELATNPNTQALLRSWGVPLIRLPLRSGLADATLIAAMQAVLAVGATPMVILPGPASGTPAGDRHLLSL